MMKRSLIPILLFLLASISCTDLFSQDNDSVVFSDLFQTALENNFSLIIARNSAEAAKINNSIGNAGFLPTIDVSAAAGNSISNSSQEFYDGRTREADGAKSKSKNALAEINWAFFDGAKMFIEKEKLSELENQGEIEIQIKIEGIYMQLATYYYALIQELKYMEVLTSSLQTSKDRYELVTKKFTLGSSSESDVIQAKLDLNADSNSVIRQRAVIENLKSDINHLTGRDPSVNFKPVDRITSSEIPEYANLVAMADQQNYDLMQARSNERVSRLTMNESVSQFMPRISLYSDYSYLASESQTGLLTSNQSFGPAYGIRLSYNVFNGLNNKRQYQINRINYENAQVLSDEVQNSIQTDLLKSYNNYISSLQVLNIEKTNITDAKQNLKLAVELYRLGQISEIDFRIVQQKTLEAENRLLLAEYQLKMAELNVLKLSGQLKIE